MKVIITSCPGCGKESQVKHYEPGESEDDIHSYQTDIKTEYCRKCANTPAAKLMKAIFGGK